MKIQAPIQSQAPLNLSTIARGLKLMALVQAVRAFPSAAGAGVRNPMIGPNQVANARDLETCDPLGGIFKGETTTDMRNIFDGTSFCPRPEVSVEQEGRKLGVDRTADTLAGMLNPALVTELLATADISEFAATLGVDGVLGAGYGLALVLNKLAEAQSGEELVGLDQSFDVLAPTLTNPTVKSAFDATVEWLEAPSGDDNQETNGDKVLSGLVAAADSLNGTSVGDLITQATDSLVIVSDFRAPAIDTLTNATELLGTINSVANELRNSSLADVNATKLIDTLVDLANTLSEVDPQDIGDLLPKVNTVLDDVSSFLNNTDRKVTVITVFLAVASFAVACASMAVVYASVGVKRAAVGDDGNSGVLGAAGDVSAAAVPIANVAGRMDTFTGFVERNAPAVQNAIQALMQGTRHFLDAGTVALGGAADGATPAAREAGQNMRNAATSFHDAARTASLPVRTLDLAGRAIAPVLLVTLGAGRAMLNAFGYGQAQAAGAAADAGPGPIPDIPEAGDSDSEPDLEAGRPA